jgi:hypothetical protein
MIPAFPLADRAQLIAEEGKQISKSEKIMFINRAERETRSIRRLSADDESEKSEESA